MDRYNTFRGQVMLATELNAAFAAIERQLWDRSVDMQLFGIMSGLAASLGSSPDVVVTKGSAFDQLGRRLKAFTDGAASKTQSYATTTAGSATSVTSGQERWISIYARWGQKASDPRLDSGTPVNFQLEECLNSNDTAGGVDKFYIIMGSSAPTGTATRPALDTDKVLLCDIKRTPSDASNVLDTTRVTLGPIRASNSVIVNALANWLGGRTNPSATLQVALDKIPTDLASQAAGDDGAERIGGQAIGSFSAGSLRSHLDKLDTDKASLTADQTWTGESVFSRPTPTTQFAHRFAQVAGFRLLFGVDGASSTDGGMRIYVEGNGRIYLTTNARWDGTNWNKDVDTRESMALIVGALSGANKHHLAICWRIASAGTWANTFGVSTGWSRILDFSGTDADYLGGSGGGLGAGIGATLLEVPKGDLIGNVNGVNSDNYWIGAGGSNGENAGQELLRVMPFRRKWSATPTAGTVTKDTTLIADSQRDGSLGVVTPPAIVISVINSIAFSWRFNAVDFGWNQYSASDARVTFSR